MNNKLQCQLAVFGIRGLVVLIGINVIGINACCCDWTMHVLVMDLSWSTALIGVETPPSRGSISCSRTMLPCLA